jgi:hypothetical protein
MIYRASAWGSKRPGSGRKQGTPNKITAEIKEIAHQYGPRALKELARTATQGESETARVAACREILSSLTKTGAGYLNCCSSVDRFDPTLLARAVSQVRRCRAR